MPAYLDSSALLRRLFEEPDALTNWDEFGPFITSSLLEVECFRTLHRARLAGRLTEAEEVRKSQEVYLHLRLITQIRMTDAVLQTAKRPFTVSLGTLDAIHLASALLWRERKDKTIVFLTHDERLAAAAQAEGFPVAGNFAPLRAGS